LAKMNYTLHWQNLQVHQSSTLNSSFNISLIILTFSKASITKFGPNQVISSNDSTGDLQHLPYRASKGAILMLV
ncbi:MAG: hypothetical protein Q8830_03895, partial [Candidatus Phytoplasma australasiaticum]|nr:hypothetical protein [Candidatus Phytoplasma australasiaticum]